MRIQNSNTLQAFWLAIGSLFSMVFAILSAAILSRYLTKTEYGTYRQILYIYNTLLIIFSAGLPKVMSYYLPRFSLQEGKNIMWKITKLLFIFGIFFSALMLFFSELIADVLNNPELDKGLKMFSIIPTLLLPTLGLEGIFSSYNKSVYIAIYNICTRFFMFLFIVMPVVIFRGSLEYAIYGWIVVSFFTGFLAFSFMKIPFKGITSKKTLLSYSDILTYSIPIASASLWSIAIGASDQYFISRYFGAEVFAVFSNGFIDLPFVYIVTSASSTVLLPVFSKMDKDNSSIEEIMKKWRSTLIKSALIIYPLVVFFGFNAKELIVLIYSNAYEDSVIFFRIGMCLNFFNIILFSPLLFSIGKTKIFSQVHFIFAVLTWILEYLLIIFFKSPVAIAICSVSLSIIRVFVFLFFLSDYFKVKLKKLIPSIQFLSLIIHSILVLTLTRIIVEMVFPYLGALVFLLVSFTMFCFILIGTGKMFKINYLHVIVPLFKNYMKNN